MNKNKDEFSKAKAAPETPKAEPEELHLRMLLSEKNTQVTLLKQQVDDLRRDWETLCQILGIYKASTIEDVHTVLTFIRSALRRSLPFLTCDSTPCVCPRETLSKITDALLGDSPLYPPGTTLVNGMCRETKCSPPIQKKSSKNSPGP